MLFFNQKYNMALYENTRFKKIVKYDHTDYYKFCSTVSLFIIFLCLIILFPFSIYTFYTTFHNDYCYSNDMCNMTFDQCIVKSCDINDYYISNENMYVYIPYVEFNCGNMNCSIYDNVFMDNKINSYKWCNDTFINKEYYFTYKTYDNTKTTCFDKNDIIYNSYNKFLRFIIILCVDILILFICISYICYWCYIRIKHRRENTINLFYDVL